MKKPRRLSMVGYAFIAILALTVLPVLLLRWLPVPTSAFMLQSPVKPVQYDWVADEQISRHMKRAVVAAEDQKFWTHQGFDLEAIEKAQVHNKRSKRKRGASTISQQTAKNLFLWPGGGYVRKGIEAGYTILIETLWPKPRILTVYLNIAEFGPGIYGVEAASRHYFRKPASALSASEAARLAAVLPSPRRWKVTRPGPYVQARSAWILRQMGHGNASGHSEPEPEMPESLRRELEADDAGAALAPAASFALVPDEQAITPAMPAEPADPAPIDTTPLPEETAPPAVPAAPAAADHQDPAVTP